MPIAWLNYHHLLYFWVVAREGSIARASAELRLSAPAISGQLRVLEDTLGRKLFDRLGRRLVLTEAGRLVYGYANEIFSLGRELLDALEDRPTGRPLRVQIGTTDVLPKLVVRKLIEPLLVAADPIQVACREDKPERLLADLSIHALDVVLADTPLGAGTSVRVFSHLLGEYPSSFVAAPAMARRLRRSFPRSLDGAPFLMPLENTALRRSLNDWLTERDLRPRIVAELEDSALCIAFAGRGLGVMCVPAPIELDLRRQHGLVVVGRAPELTTRVHAVTVERRVKHPAVLAMFETARQGLFGPTARTSPGEDR